MKVMRFRHALAAALIACCQAGGASAQSGAGRPYRALFGGATTDPSMHQAFDVMVSISEAYNDNAIGSGTAGGLDSPLLLTGLYTGVSPSASYVHVGERAKFDATVGTNLRYYGSQHGLVGTSYLGAVGFSSQTERTHVALSQTASYAPASFLGLLPSLSPLAGALPGGVADQAVDTQNARFFDGAVDVGRRLTSRASFSLLGNYRLVKLPAGFPSADLRSFGIGGRYGYDLSKNATLHAGYIYRGGRYAYAPARSGTVVHDIDIGVDYHRPLSLSRRTRLEFSVGSAIVSVPDTQTALARRQFRVLGTAGLSHDMGRTWQAKLAYHRGAGFAGGFDQPVLSDAVVGSFAGFFSRRVDFSGDLGASQGAVGLASGPGNQFRTYSANTRVRAAINPVWALFAEYLYYYYNFGDRVATASGVPSQLDRNTVRVGLTLWLPLVRR